MTSKQEWQEQFDAVFPKGVRCELVGPDGGWLFHAPGVEVIEASDKALTIGLWQMDANGNLPIEIEVRPPAELTPPTEELEVLSKDLPSKLVLSTVVPEWVTEQIPAYREPE